MAVNNSLNTPYVIGGNSSGYPTNHGILTGQGTKEVKSTVLTNGQLMIGSTGNDPIAASLTAGSNITITPGSGTITIAASGAGSNILAVQTFTASGTYTPTSGMDYCIIEAIGGGGAGGGSAALTSNTTSVGAGGGGGGYGRKIVSAATIGASQTITIGTGGAAVSGNTVGTTGGTTTVGSLITANGGAGGASTFAFPNVNVVNGPNGGSTSGADINITGNSGLYGCIGIVSSQYIGFGGQGASTIFGAGGRPAVIATATSVGAAGIAATGYGSGGGGAGGGATTGNTLGAQTSGAGASGIVVITEFI